MKKKKIWFLVFLLLVSSFAFGGDFSANDLSSEVIFAVESNEIQTQDRFINHEVIAVNSEGYTFEKDYQFKEERYCKQYETKENKTNGLTYEACANWDTRQTLEKTVLATLRFYNCEEGSWYRIYKNKNFLTERKEILKGGEKYIDVQCVGGMLSFEIDSFSSYTFSEIQALKAGLLTHWSFDNVSGSTVLDTLNYANGTIVGAQNSIEPGFIGNSYYNDGTDGNYMTFDDLFFTPFNTAGEYTYSLWINYTDDSQNQMLLTFYSELIDRSACVFSDPADYITWQTNGGSLFDAGLEGCVGGNWEMWTFVINSTNKAIYKNGVLYDIDGLNSIASSAAGHNSLGADNAGNTANNGYIDEVYIYERALSKNEIEKLYNVTNEGYTLFNYPSINAYTQPTEELYISDKVSAWNLWDWGNITGINGTIDSWGTNDGELFGKTFYAATVDGATLSNTSPVNSSLAQFGNYYEFDGVNDFIDSSINVSGSEYFTAMLWVKANTICSDNYCTLMQSDAPIRSYFGIQDNLNNKLLFRFYNSSGSFAETLESTTNFYDGTWKHLAFTYDGVSGNYILYENGVIADSTIGASTKGVMAEFSPIIGAHYETLINFFNGSIDEVKIWNRTLSQTEVQEEMASNAVANPEGIVAYYDFNEDIDNNPSIAFDNNHLSTGPRQSTLGLTEPSFAWDKGYNFDGVDDYVLLQSEQELTSNYSVSFWMKGLEQIGTRAGILGSTPTADNYIGVNKYVAVRGEYDNGNAWYIEASLNDSWIHTVLNFNSSGVFLYLDGNYIGTDAKSGNTDIQYIGAGYDLGNRNFNGSIADVRIYNKTLSEDEILTLYSGLQTKYFSAYEIITNNSVSNFSIESIYGDVNTTNGTVSLAVPFGAISLNQTTDSYYNTTENFTISSGLNYPFYLKASNVTFNVIDYKGSPITDYTLTYNYGAYTDSYYVNGADYQLYLLTGSHNFTINKSGYPTQSIIQNINIGENAVDFNYTSLNVTLYLVNESTHISNFEFNITKDSETFNYTTTSGSAFFPVVFGDTYSYSFDAGSYQGAFFTTGSTTIDTYNKTLNITSIGLVPCGSGEFVNYNFTNYNENSPDDTLAYTIEILGSFYTDSEANGISFMYNNTGSTYYELCFGTNESITTTMYIKYTTASGFTHRYYINKYETPSDETAEISLYNWNTTTGASLLNIVVREEASYGYYLNITAKLQRLYVAEDVWRTVQMDKSGDFGQLLFNIKERDTDYRIIFMDEDNNILKTTESLKFACSSGICEVTFLLSPFELSSTQTTVNVDWSYNPSTGNIFIEWNDPTGGTVEVTFSAIKFTSTGNLYLCNQTVSGAEGNATCNVAAYTGSIYLQINSTTNGIQQYDFADWLQLEPDAISTVLPDAEESVLTFMIMLVIIFTGAISPVGLIISVLFGLVAIFYFGLLNILTPIALITAIIIGLVINVRLRS